MRAKAEHSVLGLITGILILIYVVYIYSNLKNYVSTDDAVTVLGGLVAQQLLKTPIILTALAGISSIVAYSARWRYAHLIALALLIIAILELPVISPKDIFIVLAVLALLSFIADCRVN
ncbi:MAG: hypothetical protein IJU28_09865 [Clostridia bacterium]|nr:hypothetical protein [Clostridia bacterium]